MVSTWTVSDCFGKLRSGHCNSSRRLSTALQSQGLSIGRYRVCSLMRANQLRSVWRRKFVHTTDILPNISMVITFITSA